ARATLEFTLRAIEVPELQRRVAELEKALAGREVDDRIRIINVLAPSTPRDEDERVERFRELYREVSRERQTGELTPEELRLIAEEAKHLADDAAGSVSKNGECGQVAGP